MKNLIGNIKYLVLGFTFGCCLFSWYNTQDQFSACTIILFALLVFLEVIDKDN